MLLAWQLRYLGWQSLPADLSTFDIERFFTFSDPDLAAIRSRYKDELRLGAALQVGFLQMTGRALDLLDRVPNLLLKYVGKKLEVTAPNIATLRALYRRRRATLFEHQAWAIEHLGMARFEQTDIAKLSKPLADLVRAGRNFDQLQLEAKELLYKARLVIPGPQRVAALVRRAVKTVESEAMAKIERDITPEQRDMWREALEQPAGGCATLVDFIGEPPGKFSPSTVEREFERVSALQDLKVHHYTTEVLSAEHQHSYARAVTRRRPSKFRGIREPRRTLELVSFMRHSLAEHTDNFIDMADRRVVQLWRRAAERARQEGKTSSSDVFVESVRSMVAGETDPDRAADQVNQIKALLGQFDAGKLKGPCVAARQREILLTQSGQIRPLLKKLLALDLKREELKDFPVDLEAWRVAYNEETPWLTPDLVRPQSRAWEGLLRDLNPRRAFCAAEALLLWELRQALRGGRLHVTQSVAHRSMRAVLKADETTVRAANTSIPQKEFLDSVLRDLKEALDRLSQAVEEGRARIDGKNLHLKSLAPESAPADFKAMRAELYRELPAIHLPELLLKVDAQAHFSWILLGRPPRTEAELLYLYTALFGHAMDLSPPRLAMMVPGLEAAGIADALRVLEDGKALRRANDAVVEFLREHSIAAQWGRDVDCASDAMSLDVSRSISTARLDPRRRQWGTAVYGHVLGHYGIGHDMPLPVLTRQDGAAIEGALRMRAVIVERVMTDTHGQSAMAFSLAKLCGLDLCPRLKSFHDRRLHVPRGFPMPQNLKDLCIADLSMSEIEKGFVDLAALADAVAAGRLSAVTACQRHGTAARTRKAYKAGRTLGLILRTIHLCLTATNEAFRRETQRLLNHGELVHGLQRQIRRAGFGTRRGVRSEELVAQSGSLTLITNVVMAHNTQALQGVIDRRDREGHAISADIIRHLSPTAFAQVNFMGTLHFPIDQYRSQLFERSPRRVQVRR